MALTGAANGKSLWDGSATSVLFANRRIFELEPFTFSELNPNATPFMSVLEREAQMKTGLTDPLFRMFEHESPIYSQFYTVKSIATSGTISGTSESNAVTLDETAGLSAGLPTTMVEAQIGLQFEVWNSTYTTKKGYVVCTSVVTGALGTGTCKFKQQRKNSGDSADLTLAAGDKLVLIGNVQGDGAESPSAWSTELKVVWNSTQNFRTPVVVKGALLEAVLRGASNELSRINLQKAVEHAVMVNKALLRGRSVTGTNLNGGETFTEANQITDANGNLLRATTGVLTSLENYGSATETDDQQNIFDRSQGYAFSKWIDDSFKIFQYIGIASGGMRKAFCGPAALSYWSKINSDSKLKSQFQISLSDMKQNKLGYNFKYLESPFGIVEMIYEPAFRDAGYRNYMFIPTMQNLFLAQFTQDSYHTNILTDNRPKLVKNEYDSDKGAGMVLVKSHHLIKTPNA